MGVAGNVVVEESVEALDAFLVVFTLETSPMWKKHQFYMFRMKNVVLDVLLGRLYR